MHLCLSRFIKKACDKGTQEYRQLYYFLLKCFTEGDANRFVPAGEKAGQGDEKF